MSIFRSVPVTKVLLPVQVTAAAQCHDVRAHASSRPSQLAERQAARMQFAVQVKGTRQV